MELVKVSGSTYNEVRRNLDILEDEGIITQKCIGKSRVINLILGNKKTMILIEALKIIESHVMMENLRTYRYNLDKKQEVDIGPTKNVSFKSEFIGQQNEVQIRNDKCKWCHRDEAIPDAFSLLSMPKPLRLTVMALYDFDRATAQELSSKTNRPEQLEGACAGQLVEMGYINSLRQGEETYFFIDC